MSIRSFEIRICTNCGLRYPLTNEQKTGARCPHCLGETRLVTSRELYGDNNPMITENPKPRSMTVLLDNIRSAWNVGSILRSADGFGFSHAYLCGITPTPEQDSVQKTSLGGDESVTWSYHKDALKLAKGLKKEGWRIWALEEHERALEIGKAKPGKSITSTVLILGNEVTGNDPQLLDLCDGIFFIPMSGRKRSFNVAVAFGIAAYALSDR